MKTIIIIIFISLLSFTISALWLKSTLNNPTTLAQELHSPSGAAYLYELSNKEPYKYRILFPTIVKYSFFSLSSPSNNYNFYLFYIFWSGLFYISSAISFYFLLKSLRFSVNYSFPGVLLFLASPAIFLAFSLPVHTREDFLAYTILCLGLICIIKNNHFGVWIFTVLGVLCRETLLLIPLLYLLHGKKGVLSRISLMITSLIIFTMLRFNLHVEGYDPIALGLVYNLENLSGSIGFTFLTFSFMWPAFLFDIFVFFKDRTAHNHPLILLRKSAAYVFLLVFLSTIILGRLNEIRLLFLLFPWVIPIFLHYFKTYLIPIAREILNRRYMLFALFSFLVCSFLFITIFPYRNNLGKGIYEIPFSQWIITTCIYLFFFILSIPIYLHLIKEYSQTKKYKL